MTPGHIVIWYIDKGRIESDKPGHVGGGWSVEGLSERVQRDLEYYDCIRIHTANGYGCAFLDGNLSDIILDLLKYKPYLSFKLRPPSDRDQVGVIFEKMKQGAQPPDMEAVLGTSIERFEAIK